MRQPVASCWRIRGVTVGIRGVPALPGQGRAMKATPLQLTTLQSGGGAGGEAPWRPLPSCRPPRRYRSPVGGAVAPAAKVIAASGRPDLEIRRPSQTRQAAPNPLQRHERLGTCGRDGGDAQASREGVGHAAQAGAEAGGNAVPATAREPTRSDVEDARTGRHCALGPPPRKAGRRGLIGHGGGPCGIGTRSDGNRAFRMGSAGQPRGRMRARSRGGPKPRPPGRPRSGSGSSCACPRAG